MTSVLLLGKSHINIFEAFIAKSLVRTPSVWNVQEQLFTYMANLWVELPNCIMLVKWKIMSPYAAHQNIKQIGGNDLDSVDIIYKYTKSIVERIISVCQRFLEKYSVKDVVIGQFLPHYETWYCDVVYNERDITANRLLKQKPRQVHNIHYWKLKGLKHAENLFKDGVHLTDQSQKNSIEVSVLLLYTSLTVECTQR